MREAVELLYTHLWIVLHHRVLVIICAIIICIVGWMGTSLIPDKYKVETKIFLDSDTVLNPLMKGLAVENLIKQESALVMRRTLLTRPNLMEVIHKSDLDLRARNKQELENIIKNLQNNIKINTVIIPGVGRGDESGNIFDISYINSDPVLAKKIVDSLLNIFVENILGSSRKDSEQAQAFLDKQIDEYQNKLEQAEEKLKIFKQTYSGLMPGESINYYSMLNQNQNSLDEAQLSLKEKINHSRELQKQIDNLKKNNPQNGQNPALIISNPIDDRINKLKIQLDDLLTKYTEEHPDVIATRRMLEELEKQKRQQDTKEIKNINKGEDSQILNSKIYQELNILHGQAEAEVAALRTRVDTFQKKVDEMKSIINNIPQIESELKKLNRDYGIIKKTYDELLQRKTSAQLSQEADQSSSEFQFNIVEPPTIPLTPDSPNRLLLITAVFVLGIVGGIAIGIIYEMIKPTFYTQDQIQNEIDMPVIGCLYMNWSESDFRERRNHMIIFSTALLLLVVIYIALVTLNLNHIPLTFDIPFLNK